MHWIRLNIIKMHYKIKLNAVLLMALSLGVLVKNIVKILTSTFSVNIYKQLLIMVNIITMSKKNLSSQKCFHLTSVHA